MERFWHCLALAHQEPSIVSLKLRLTTREFQDWMDYFAVEPFGARLVDAHFARIEFLLANQWAKRAKGKPADWRLHASEAPAESKLAKFARVQASFQGMAAAQERERAAKNGNGHRRPGDPAAG
jgi:hypothetical protein